MFAFPDAKRVRREELYDSSTDGEESRDEEVDAALRAKLSAQLSGLLDFNFAPAADTSHDDAQRQQQQQQRDGASVGDDGHHQAEREGEELVFQFRLFRDEAPSHKVVLEQDEAPEQAGGGAFVIARRPASYYVADDPPPDAMARFRAAAVSPDHIFRDAGRRRWGLEKPWRVTTITITANTATGAAVAGGDEPGSRQGEEAGKRKRPGKRRRIILRTREKARREREEATKQQLVEKELHLKEKKKRLNREKKLKRRAKEREKKLASKDGGDAASEHTSRATSPAS
ncbi:hypothetical protein DL770_006622 [Monosporascus sp. CRB-9-2]|nr:hypothetical protein DL770_006622 [Monosporascus sp. CRB-9-2]